MQQSKGNITIFLLWITAELSDVKYFSILEANSGFWQIPLDKESSDLCCFNSVFGRHKFLRLPYGVHSASEVFQKRMTEMFENVEGVVCYIDDVLVWGRSKEEHDERLRTVLEVIRDNNVKLNKQKCKFAQTDIRYLGHQLTMKVSDQIKTK